MSVQVKGSGTIGGLDEGLVVSGIITSSTQLNVGSNIKLGSAGVVTATSFVGSGANLTNLPAANLTGTVPIARIGTGTKNNTTFYRGDGTFQVVSTDLVGDSSPQLGGDLDTNSHHILIDDDHEVKFGNDSDLRLFHSGSQNLIQSYNNKTFRIQSFGTGQTKIQVAESQNSVVCIPSGATELYHSGNKKFETTNTGVTVTGTVTATSFSGNIVAGAGTSNITAGIITATNIELAIPTSRRNFFINGGMYVAARGTVTGLNAGGYGGPDHIKLVNNLGVFTVAQGNENDSPRSEGFTYSYKLNCTSASGPSNSNYVYLNHAFSGYDLQLLKYGYTNPHPITISFWAKSNKTGNFTVTFRTIAGVDRLISKVFTISNSNWNFYSATFVGDTSAVNVTEGQAYLLEIWLDGGSNYTGGTVQTSWSARSNADRGAGSTLNIASSTSNYFYYTGLQVELGAVATPFEHQLYQWYQHECYRYFYHPNRSSDQLELHGMGHRVADTMGAVVQAYPWPRQMRAAPTLSFNDNAGNSNRFAVNGSNNSTTNNVLLSLQQNDQGIMGAFQYPHGITNISENESFRLWAYNFKAEAEF